MTGLLNSSCSGRRKARWLCLLPLQCWAAHNLTAERFAPESGITLQSRLSYSGQLLIARKMSERLSLQLMPTLLYRNRTNFNGESNLVTAIGVAGRYKISKRVAFNGEYYAVLPDQLNPGLPQRPCGRL